MGRNKGKMKDYVDFEKNFRKLVGSHKDDKCYELIKDYPEVFSTILGIASDRSADGMVKMIVNSAISYFVLITDAISEKEEGIKGYIDDFFVCIYALRELLKHDKKLGEYLIKKHWKLKEDYNNYIPKKYYELIKKIDQKIVSEIISYSGMGFISEVIFSKEQPKTYSQQKIRDLQGKIFYMFYLFLNRPLIGKEQKRNFEDRFFGTEEFMDFAKKLKLLSKSDDQFAPAQKNVDEMFDIDVRLRKAKAKRLLK